jgi:putative membrane protein
MRPLVWLLRAFLFFTLFAFALNNQQTVVVHWFFGVQWSAPLVIVVLAAFVLGCAVGVVFMVPSWLRQRRVAAKTAPATGASATPAPSTMLPSEFGPEHPPREGL